MGDSNEPIDAVSSYFLGSIVLIKGDKPDAEIIDGQQRLTTLTILLAVLRASISDNELIRELTPYLYQKGGMFSQKPTLYRLSLRKRDEEFFKENIQDEGGIDKLKNLNSAEISDSQRNIKENVLRLLTRLESISEAKRISLGQFIITRCFLVVVSTPDSDSAYRIFSVMNDRGLDLSPTDILKADIIGQISEQQQESYTAKWEDIEEELRRDKFRELFSHIRMIYRKTKPAESIIKEFREYVKPTDDPQYFIDKVLSPLADAFYDIQNSDYKSSNQVDQSKINSLFRWLNQIDNSDWLPPAILYFSHNRNSPTLLVSFFQELERLSAGLMIKRASTNERIERYGRLLNSIEKNEDLFISDSPLQLTTEEQQDILRNLDGDLYLMKKIRLYVLLRLDDALADAGAIRDFPIVTVEHVLPQNPKPDGNWSLWFPSQEDRNKYVHRLGNLLLLSRSKNSEAQNFEFEDKKKKYFTTGKRVANFAITSQVLNETEWTSSIIEQRQRKLLDELEALWRL